MRGTRARSLCRGTTASLQAPAIPPRLMDAPCCPHPGAHPAELSRRPGTYVAVQAPGAIVELAHKDVCRAVCANGSQKQVGLLLLVHACEETRAVPLHDRDSWAHRHGRAAIGWEYGLEVVIPQRRKIVIMFSNLSSGTSFLKITSNESPCLSRLGIVRFTLVKHFHLFIPRKTKQN